MNKIEKKQKIVDFIGWNVVMVSEGTKRILISGFKTEEEAKKFADSENWCYVDENEFEWLLDVEEATPKHKK